MELWEGGVNPQTVSKRRTPVGLRKKPRPVMSSAANKCERKKGEHTELNRSVGIQRI